MPDETWLADAPLYLDRSDTPLVRPSRPMNQGDVFLDVSIAAAGRGDDKAKVTIGPVMLLGHPCSIHAGGRVIDTQFVAAVRPKEDATHGRPFDAPWTTHLYLFPLPGLIDGRDYVADFRRVGTTHFKNLDERRIACLSREGWAALQRRWAWHTLRADIPLVTRYADLAGLWNELAIWEEWVRRGNVVSEFTAWRDSEQVSGSYVGTKRADLLDFAFDELMEELPSPASP